MGGGRQGADVRDAFRELRMVLIEGVRKVDLVTGIEKTERRSHLFGGVTRFSHGRDGAHIRVLLKFPAITVDG